MHRVLRAGPESGPGLPVPTGSQAAAFDARARERGGIPGRVLMESAGRAAADVAESLLRETPGGRPGGPVVVLAGAGGNGGDGVVLARTLHARGHPVRLFVDPRRPDPDPLLHGHPVPVEPLGEAAPLPALSEAALVVDALLGIGLRQAPEGPMAEVIRGTANAVAARGGSLPVLALDLPSGVLADSGAVPGAVIPASTTVAFGAPKLGSLLHPGRGVGGRLIVVEIGFPPWAPADARGLLITGAMAAALLPERPLDTHKNAVGRLLLVAGGESMGGAAILAARAALRAGVGMLRVLCHPVHRKRILDERPEVIVVDPRDPEAVAEAVAASDAVALGPGMGLDPQGLPTRALPALFGAGPRALLLDADGLTLLGSGGLPLEGFRVAPVPGSGPSDVGPAAEGGATGRRAAEGPAAPGMEAVGVPALLTPHRGELSRILPPDVRERVPGASAEAPVEGFLDPLAAAQAAADRWGAACLLKGAPSVVAAPGVNGEAPPPVRISASGGSSFARGGMGDVLTGVAGALLARGLSPADAGALALHLTGRAADLANLPPEALLPSDLLTRLPAALTELREGGPTAAFLALHGVPSFLMGLDAPR